MKIFKAKLTIKYILFELLPVTLFAIAVFIFLLFMFQSFKLSEYIIVHGASISTVAQIFSYFSLSFLPIIIPTSLLFAILIVYGRLSSDSEVVAMKAIGVHPFDISVPALIMGAGFFFLTLQVSTQLAPWGNQQLDDLVHRVSQNRPTVSVREGVFSEGFFDLVVYANEVDQGDGTLRKVFIYDERDSDSPLTIISSAGRVIIGENDIGQTAMLRLEKGSMHSSAEDIYTKINFGSYDVKLIDAADRSKSELDIASMTADQLENKFESTQDEEEQNEILLEMNRRWTLPAVCLIFAIIGVGLGTSANRRSGKSGGLVICISVVISYWMVYAFFETFAKQEVLPIYITVWIPNFLFLLFGLHHWRKVLRT